MYKYIVVSCDDACAIDMVGCYDSLSEAKASMLGNVQYEFNIGVDIQDNAQLNELKRYVFKSDGITVMFGDRWCRCKDGESMYRYRIFKIEI